MIRSSTQLSAGGISLMPFPYRQGSTQSLHFIERNTAERNELPASGRDDRTFNIFCNGRAIISNVNLRDEAGENRPLMKKIRGVEPNAQGKLLLEFVPVTRYATVSAIEVVPE